MAEATVSDAASGRREIGRFEFAIIASLRTTQLMRGCTPRVSLCGKLTTTARREVAEGRIRGLSPGDE